MTLPNLITIGRILAVPLIVWLIVQGEYRVALLVVAAAGASDAIDGFIAKRYGLGSELGAYLDPIADKLMLVAIYVALGVRDLMPAWLVIAVVSRDVLIVGAVMLSWQVDRPVTMAPHIVSKANTLVQIVFACSVLAAVAFGLQARVLVDYGSFVVAALTLASLAIYLRGWLAHMARSPGDDGPERP